MNKTPRWATQVLKASTFKLLKYESLNFIYVEDESYYNFWPFYYHGQQRRLIGLLVLMFISNKQKSKLVKNGDKNWVLSVFKNLGSGEV